MARKSSQATQEGEGCLARMSRWATALLVIPLLTGLSFAASTVLLSLYMPPGYVSYYPENLSIPIVCLILGFGLGFLLRWALIRIRTRGLSSTVGVLVVVGVASAWFVAVVAQVTLYFILTI